jgi:ABC-type glycerol-3-phosphate transport system substrate-binding protein
MYTNQKSIIPHFIKKITKTSLVLTFMISTGVLSACGAGGEVQPPKPQQVSPAAQISAGTKVAPIAAEQFQPSSQTAPTIQQTSTHPIENVSPNGVKIRFWYSMSDEQIAPIFKDFNTNNEWGIEVDAVNLGSNTELSNSVIKGIIENDAPTVVLAFSDQAINWDKNGNIVNLSPYIDNPNWGLSPDEQNDFFPFAWNYGLVDNKRLSVPAQIASTFLFYNQSWAKELGFDTPPDSVDTFTEQACAANAVKKKDKDVKNDSSGGWIIDTKPEIMLAWFHAFGGGIVSASDVNVRNSRYHFDTNENEEAFFYQRRLFEKNCAWDFRIDPKNEAYPDEEFAHRRALFVSGNLTDIPYQITAFTEANNKDEWTLLPYPSPIGKPVIASQIPSFILIQSTPEQELAGWLFMRWMISPGTQVKWSMLTGLFPVRASSKNNMPEYSASHPQWTVGFDLLLKGTILEPVLPSWGTVRWALQDASTQLFRSYFTLERVPLTLKELDNVAQSAIDMDQ